MIVFSIWKSVEAVAFALVMTIALSGGVQAQDTPSFTTGPAKTTNPGLFACHGARARVSPVGTIRSDDGRLWVVPADTHFQTATKAADLYNQCSGVRLRQLSDLDLKKVPVIDAGGEETFTAYIFADNYFELYVNGKLLGVDAIPFTPFNSSVVRFKANRPFTIAVMGVDWEETWGLVQNGTGASPTIRVMPGLLQSSRMKRGVRLPLRINPGAPRRFTPRRSTIDRA